MNIRSENIHKEEFANMIKNDEFVTVRLFFNCFKHANRDEFGLLKDKIFIIENELQSSPKDLTKLRDYIRECENPGKTVGTNKESLSPVNKIVKKQQFEYFIY